MARRTKEEALETREQILDAAERLFEQRGVSRTSLQAIAAEATITRGAIYWHFKDKADLFNAMVERIQWPTQDAKWCAEAIPLIDGDPIEAWRYMLSENLRTITQDTQVRRLLGICHFQIEYTSDMAAVKTRMLESHASYFSRTLQTFQHPSVSTRLRPGISALSVARTVQHGIIGLIEAWLRTPEAFDLLQTSEEALDLILCGAGIEPSPSRLAAERS